MNKNESLSQDRSFSSYPTSSSNINIQFIPSIQGSSPQYTSSSLRNYVENPPFDRSSPSSLDGCHLFEESQSWIVELHYLIWRAIRCRLNDYFLTIYLQCCVTKGRLRTVLLRQDNKHTILFILLHNIIYGNPLCIEFSIFYVTCMEIFFIQNQI